MALTDYKITHYLKNIVDLPDRPAISAADLKAYFDGRTDAEVKDAINGIIDELAGNSGAQSMGTANYLDITANNVEAFLQQLADKRVIFSSPDTKYIRVNQHMEFEISADGIAWQKVRTGHTILDSSGTVYPNRTGIRFENSQIFDIPGETIVRNTQHIYTGTCSTAASVAAKVVVLDAPNGFSRTAGTRVAVTFTYGNSSPMPRLNVNSTGEAIIVFPTSYSTEAFAQGDTVNSWGDYETLIFTFDGVHWRRSASALAGFQGSFAYYNHAPKDSPNFTGTPTAPTAANNTNNTQIATTAFVKTAISGKAPLANPTFTGTPAAPTPDSSDNSTRIATTAFVQNKTSNLVDLTGFQTIEGYKNFTEIGIYVLDFIDADLEGNVYGSIVVDEDGNGNFVLSIAAEDYINVVKMDGDPAEIRGLATPTTNSSAVNKAYVDGLVGDIETALGALL